MVFSSTAKKSQNALKMIVLCLEATAMDIPSSDKARLACCSKLLKLQRPEKLGRRWLCMQNVDDFEPQNPPRVNWLEKKQKYELLAGKVLSTSNDHKS